MSARTGVLGVLGVVGRTEHRVLAALLLLAALMRLALFPSPGNLSDMTGLYLFGAQVAAHGPHALYDNPEITDTFYVIPPLFPFLLGASYRLFSLASGGVSIAGADPVMPGAPPANVASLLVKGWALAADLALGALIYRTVRPQAGPRWALASAAAYLLNPGLIYDTAWWGQIESVYVLCVAASLAALAERRPAATLLWWTAALLVKPQALVALPAIGLGSLATAGVRGVLRGALAGAALALACALPFLLTGRLEPLVATYTRVADVHPRVTVNAYNLWWAASGPKGGLEWVADSEPLAAGLTYRQAGFLLLGVYAALTCLALWRALSSSRPHETGSPEPAMLAPFSVAAALYVAFFMLPTQIHERYLFPGVALLTLVLFRHPLLPLAFGALSLGFVGNLVHVLPWDPAVALRLNGIGVTPWRLALLNVLAFACAGPLFLLPAHRSDANRRWVRAVLPAAATLALMAFGAAVQAAPPGSYQPGALDPLLFFFAALAVCGTAHAIAARRPGWLSLPRRPLPTGEADPPATPTPHR